MIALKALLRRALQQARVKLAKPAGQNILLAWLYYLLLDWSKLKSAQKSLQGINRNLAERAFQKQNNAVLRRNIHRLEKGLISTPFRNEFAVEFIAETVELYVLASQENGHDNDELDWAFAVLSKYFSSVNCNNPVISLAHEIFCQHPKRADDSKVPYLYRDKVCSTLSYDDFMLLSQARRSIRTFKAEPLDKAAVSQVVAAALQAPSACNRQSIEFIAVQTHDKKSRLAELAGGAASFKDNIPCLIAIVGDYSGYQLTRDRRLIYIDGGLAVMELLLAAESLGLGACPINWPAEYKRDNIACELLKLAPYKQIIMLVALGKPDCEGKVAYSQKKPPSACLTFIE